MATFRKLKSGKWQARRNDNNNVKITTLKNSSSYRTIGINDKLVRALKKLN